VKGILGHCSCGIALRDHFQGRRLVACAELRDSHSQPPTPNPQQPLRDTHRTDQFIHAIRVAIAREDGLW
jgi:hypothetical protein